MGSVRAFDTDATLSLLDLCEDQLRRPMTLPKNGSLAERIWKIFMHKKFRRSRPGDLSADDVARYMQKIQTAIDEDRPIEVAMIAWPFKSLRKTTRRYPDLGELAMIRQMRWLAASVQKIYAPGMRWIVFTEGDLYAPIIQPPDGYVEAYDQGIREFIEMSGASDIFELIPLHAVLQGDPEWSSFLAEEVHRLEGDVHARGAVAAIGAPYLETMWTSISFPGDPPFHERESTFADRMRTPTWRARTDRVVATALQYVAINTAKHRVFGGAGFLACAHDPDLQARRLHETALYVSITPKPGRYAFWALGPGKVVFPHHGSAVLTNGSDVDVRLHTAIDRTLCTPVFIDGDFERQPFFYAASSRVSVLLRSLEAT